MKRIGTIGSGLLAAALAAAPGHQVGAAPAGAYKACEKCHKQAADDVAAHGGKHKDFACGDCHAEAHPAKGKGKLPDCASCHDGHVKETKATDCGRCHRAHAPREVRYGLDVPSKECGACHQKAFDLLSATKSRHKPLRCALCHQKEHRAKQTCAHCHGSPHASGAVTPAAGCSCHGSAHDLDRADMAVPAQAPVKK